MSSSHYVSLCLQFFSSGENEMLSKVRHKSFRSRIKIFDDHAIPISQSRWCRRSPRTMRSLKRLLKARSAPRMTRSRLWGAQVDSFFDLGQSKLFKYENATSITLKSGDGSMSKVNLSSARALESENSLLQEEKGMIMRENTSNRASLEAKIQR